MIPSNLPTKSCAHSSTSTKLFTSAITTLRNLPPSISTEPERLTSTLDAYDAALHLWYDTLSDALASSRDRASLLALSILYNKRQCSPSSSSAALSQIGLRGEHPPIHTQGVVPLLPTSEANTVLHGMLCEVLGRLRTFAGCDELTGKLSEATKERLQKTIWDESPARKALEGWVRAKANGRDDGDGVEKWLEAEIGGTWR